MQGRSLEQLRSRSLEIGYVKLPSKDIHSKMPKFTITSMENHLLLVSTVIAVLAALIASRTYNYLLRRWKLSAFPLYDDKKVTPIEELHGSRDLIAEGFAKFQVSWF